MEPELIADDLSQSSGGGWSELFLECFHRHNFLFMIICAHWLLSPMSQKWNKRKS